MKSYVAVCALAATVLAAPAQQKVIPVWPGAAPGSEAWAQKEVEFPNPRTQERMVRNVVLPTMTAFFPDPAKANGTAVVIAPGGGFRLLSWDSEGVFVAEYLKARGVAAFVLKYRLTETPVEGFDILAPAAPAQPAAGRSTGAEVRAMAVADARQALQLVREHAAEWHINPGRIGLMGFSAGAITTMGVVMNHTAQNRPDFAAPIYGGNTGGVAVPEDAPPLFICVADDDRMMSASSAKLYLDWKAANKSAELHVYSKGGHGFGLTKHNLPVDSWIDRFRDWLDVQGLLKPATR